MGHVEALGADGAESASQLTVGATSEAGSKFEFASEAATLWNDGRRHCCRRWRIQISRKWKIGCNGLSLKLGDT